jgi:predicted HTH domain antitoxin
LSVEGEGHVARKLHFEWDLPEEVFDDRFREEELLARVKEDAVVRLFQEGRLSTAYGAALLGLTRRQFFELLDRHKVPYLALPEEEFAREAEAAGKLARERKGSGEKPT